jgi:transcriptional regulator with XRE-family HTH domain
MAQRQVINAEALKAIREAKNLTITDLATRAGYSWRYIKDLEVGRRDGQAAEVQAAVAEALEVPVAAIVRPKARKKHTPKEQHGVAA